MSIVNSRQLLVAGERNRRSTLRLHMIAEVREINAARVALIKIALSFALPYHAG